MIPSGGGKPEGKEGEQYSHVRGRTPVPTPEHDVYSIIITSRHLTLSFG